MALSLVVPTLAVPEVDAATKPKLSASKVSVKVKKTKKITVKGVKAKKIKKTTWSISKKKIAKITKKTKTSVTIKGLKKGSAKLTAKIKVGKKTYTKKCTVNVTAGVTPTATPTEVPTPTPIPTLRPLTSVDAVDVPVRDLSEFKDSIGDGKVDEATALAFSSDFEEYEIGTKSQDCVTEENPNPVGLGGAILRGCNDSNQTGKDYLEIVDGSTLEYESDDAKTNETKVLKCWRQAKTWQGPMFTVTDKLDGGCTYKLTGRAYSPGTDMMASYQLQTTPLIKETYGNFSESNKIIKLPKGEWVDFEFDIVIPDDKYYYAFYFESYNGGTNSDIYLDDIKVTKVIQPAEDKTIASIKDTYADVFEYVGVGAGIGSLFGERGLEFINSQFNAYTPGNEMKPDALLGSSMTVLTLEEAKAAGYYIPENYTSFEHNRYKNKDGEFVVPAIDFTTVDQIMKTCHENNLKLRGHTLVWHQQMPMYLFQQYFKTASSEKYNVTADCMSVREEYFVKNVMEHILTSPYADCLYAYDVVNEYLHCQNDPDVNWEGIYGLTDSSTNSGVSLRPIHVKQAFKWAHEKLVEHNRTDVKLFYNDYNCYGAGTPEDIVHLIDFINEDGKICDGLGMQSHLDITHSYHSAKNYATALEFFRVNMPEIEIHITELDATMTSTDTNPLYDENQAAYYDQIMNAILTNKKNGGNITGFILWSLYDGVSWRDTKFPCVFKGLFAPKSAFYAVLDAKELYWK